MPRPAASPVATPGVPTTDNGETDADALTAGAADLDDSGGAQTGDEGAAKPAGKAKGGKTVALSADELQAMLTQAAAQGAAAVHRAVRPRPTADAELPDQSEIDPAKIKSPTLSKQGYVVPLGYGEPANPAIKR